MDLTTFQLVGFTDEDEFINGLRFSLKVDQVKKIIAFFRSQKKWTEYYFHQISKYYLTENDLERILDLEANFWMNNKIMFDFAGLTINYIGEDFDKSYIMGFQGYSKSNIKPSHFYLCWSNEEEQITQNDLSCNVFLDEVVIKNFENKQRTFDTKNYLYKLEKLPVKEFYFRNGEMDSAIILDPSPEIWEEEE